MRGRFRVLLFPAGMLMLALLAACARPGTSAPAAAEADASRAPAGAAASADGAPQTARPERTLAYEHTVSVELRQETLPARTREVQDACASRTELGCTLLDISLDEQSQVPSARIVLRLAPGQVDPMIEIAARGGRILSRSTHAEDLAQPIADTERQITLLTMHRDRLTEFLKRSDLKVQDVLALSREISSAQTDIETLGATKATLRRRVDTERLTLELSPPRGAYSAARTPIRNALRSFGDDFAGTLGLVIRLVAMILPLLLLAVPVTVAGWWLRRRRSRLHE